MIKLFSLPLRQSSQTKNVEGKKRADHVLYGPFMIWRLPPINSSADHDRYFGVFRDGRWVIIHP